jgi:D-alanyl-lipoteichoic acid acyltransferase DltB (MBOAT superfamily)
MPSSAYVYLFLALPCIWLGYALLCRWASRGACLGWLALCSAAAYGLWDLRYVMLIAPSLLANYLLAVAIRRSLAGDGDRPRRLASALLAAGIALNLCFLAYFKYRNFFLAGALGARFELAAMILPLGISFITFQKIAFLLDVRAGKAEFDLPGYLAFVLFFPQLTAGPILHYRELMPQFARNGCRVQRDDLLAGGCMLAIGLFKKVALADGIDGYVAPVYLAAGRGEAIGAAAAWIGALGYTFQIYFDFSGYSDMAIGLARLFGVRLPLNFSSPFKSSNIIDFWTRWHMSLSRFLNTYIYMPVMMRMTTARTKLGKPMLSNKKLAAGAFVSVVMLPTLLTMLLSGIWHGANPTFLVWGLMHGVFLCVNQAWRAWRPKWNRAAYDRVMVPLGFLLTFGAVLLAIVVFRAPSLAAAGLVFQGMLGLGGAAGAQAIGPAGGGFGGLLGSLTALQHLGPDASLSAAGLFIVFLFLVSTLAPNSQEFLSDLAPALDYPPKRSAASAAAAPPARAWRSLAAIRLRRNPAWAVAIAALFALGCQGLAGARTFIYWQF